MKIVAEAYPKSYKIVFDEKYRNIASIEIEDIDENLHEFTGISGGGNSVPDPQGCKFFVEDIKDRQMCAAKYEISFSSSYTRDGVFWSETYRKVKI